MISDNIDNNEQFRSSYRQSFFFEFKDNNEEALEKARTDLLLNRDILMVDTFEGQGKSYLLVKSKTSVRGLNRNYFTKRDLKGTRILKKAGLEDFNCK